MLLGYQMNYKICKLKNITFYIEDSQTLKLLIYRGVFSTFSMTFVFICYTKLKISDATVLIHTNPIWSIFLALFFLGERLSLKKCVCCFISFIGIILVSRPNFLFDNDDLSEHSKIEQF